MSYSLGAVHYFVEEWLNPENTISSPPMGGEWWAQIAKAIEDTYKSKQGFLQGAVGMNNEALQTWVNIYVAGCTSLANSIYLGKQRANEKDGLDGQAWAGIEKLENALLGQLFWFREYFLSYYNDDQSVPLALAEKEREKIRLQLDELESGLGAEKTDGELIAVIKNGLENGLKTLSGKLTYRQFSYVETICGDIKSTLLDSAKHNTLDAVTNVLIRHSFNDPAFIRYTIHHLKVTISESPSLEDALVQWQQYKKEVQQIQTSELSLYPGTRGAKERIVTAINEELHFLGVKRTALAAIYGNNGVNTPGVAKKDIVLTSLSVSQVAVLCRLFIDIGIVQHKNQTEFLKIIAGALQTTRATHISAESLRVKYYAPEPAAINIVKEHLHNMLNQLKKY